MDSYEPDYLDEVVALRAESEPELAGQWAATNVILRIRKIREERGITQAQVAERMGLPQPHVARIERRPWTTSFARILAYAQAVGVDLSVTEPERREPIAA